MTDVTTTRSPNGSAPALKPREQVSEHLRSLVQGLTTRREDLVADLAELDAELRAFHKALAALDPPPPGEPQPASKKRGTPSQVGPERLAEIERVVRELVSDDPDGEISQIQVRTRTGHSSAVMANAFAQLRDANVIRLARVGPSKHGRGMAKFFRLTRPGERGDATAARPGAATTSPTRGMTDETRRRVLDAFRATQALDQPATLGALKAASDGVSDVALRNAVHALEAEGTVRDLGPAPHRADGKAIGKMPRAYALAEPDAPVAATEDER